MKKLLLASVATLAVAAFAAGQAMAADEANNGLKLGLGGYYSVQGAYGWQSDKPGKPGQNVERDDIFQYGELNFTAEKTFDNGLTVGYKGVIELPVNTPTVTGGSTTTPTITTRQDYGYFSGNWGRFELGQNYSPLYYMSLGAPAVNDEFDSIDPDFNLVNVGTAFTGVGGGLVGAAGNTLGGGNYATYGFTPFYHSNNPLNGINNSNSGLLADKVVYYTPRFNGFQMGASYTPSADRTGDSIKSATGGFVPNQVFDVQDQRLEVAAGYDATWYGVGTKISGGYGHAQLEGRNNGILGNDVELKDEQSWIAGVQLSYKGFTLGGGYLWDDNGQSFRTPTGLSANGETNVWNAGLGYELGPYHAGVTYFDSETDVIHTATTSFKSNDSLKRWVIGGGYKVAPGVDLESTLQFQDYATARSDLNPLGNNQATVLTLGTTVNF